MTTKRCTRCGQERDLGEFSKHGGTKDGLRPNCKPCGRAYNVAYYRKHNESARAARARYRSENIDAVRAMSRNWNAANSERHKANGAAWRAANAERKRRTNQEWLAANRDRKRATNSAWTKANADKKRDACERRRARRLAQFVADVDRRLIWERDQGICGICGTPAAADNWHLDHVIPLSRGGTHEPANVQVSHPFCNTSKGARMQRSLEKSA